jgi:hypothetical protein
VTSRITCAGLAKTRTTSGVQSADASGPETIAKYRPKSKQGAAASVRAPAAASRVYIPAQQLPLSKYSLRGWKPKVVTADRHSPAVVAADTQALAQGALDLEIPPRPAGLFGNLVLALDHANRQGQAIGPDVTFDLSRDLLWRHCGVSLGHRFFLHMD